MLTIKENLLLTFSCAVSDGRATDAEEGEFIAYIESLVADANRYRFVRELVGETDKEKQARMLLVIDSFEPVDMENVPTPEQIDALVDGAIAKLRAARDQP